MIPTSPPKYLTNKQLLAEIHRSKVSFCYFVAPEFQDFDTIVETLEDINFETSEAVLLKRNSQRRRNTTEVKKTLPTELVFRVMTYEHIPLCEDKKTRSRAPAGEGHLRVNFPPFKHYRLLENGSIEEVGRSHWVNGLQNGWFSQDHGRINHRLARMFLLLVERYARRGNWRGYTYNDEMQSSALLQLSQIGLQFDEAKGENPFAFYTQVMKNCFTRVFNVERKVQNIRDDLLIMNGAAPSYTRQIENELGQKFADQGQAPTKAKRGRKPKAVVEAAAAVAAATVTPEEE